MLIVFLSSVTVARLGVAIVPLGLFFAAPHSPSPSATLLLASVSTTSAGLTLWPSGRLLDRLGRRRGLRWSMVAAAGASLLAAAAIVGGAPVAVQLAAVSLAGAVWSPIVSGPRAVLPELARPRVLGRASGLEAASYEVALLVAPVIAAPVGQRGSAVVFAVATGMLSTGWALQHAVRPGSAQLLHQMREATYPAQPRHHAAGIGLAALAFLLGCSGGLLEPALASAPAGDVPDPLGSPAAPFVAIGLGSLAGGLVAARVDWPSVDRHAIPLFALHAIGLAVAGRTFDIARLLALAAAGLAVAPLNSLAGRHVDIRVPPRQTAETLAIAAATLTVGAGIGQAAAARLLTDTLTASQVMVAAATPVAVAAIATTASALHNRPVRVRQTRS